MSENMENRLAADGMEYKPAQPVRACEWFALILIVLLPVKMGTMANMPAIPLTYSFDLWHIIFSNWPIPVFAVLSGALLTCVLFAGGYRLIRHADFSLNKVLFLLLWMMSLIFSFSGYYRVQCPEHANQFIVFFSGVTSFTAAIGILLQLDSDFRRKIYSGLFIGFLLSMFSGLHQYFIGFEEQKQALAEKSQSHGVNLLAGKVGISMQEQRLTADFGICNIYGGYLAALMPICVYMVWDFAERRISPAKVSRWVLTVPVLLSAVFLIWKTGSRGALFAMLSGFVLAVIFYPLNKKNRIYLSGLLALGAVGFGFMTAFGRGIGSMRFRIDYYYTALRSLAAHPFCGSGWGGFFKDYLIWKTFCNDEAPHSPHNLFLLFGSQAGIFAMLFVILAVLLPCICSRHLMRKSENRYFAAALSLSYFIFLTDSLLDLGPECPAFFVLFNITGLLLIHQFDRNAIPLFPHKQNIPHTGKINCFRLFIVSALILGVFTIVFGVFMGRREAAFSRLVDKSDVRYRQTSTPPNPEDVEKLLREAVSVNPVSPYPWMSAAQYFASVGRFSRQEQCASEAIQRCPDRFSFYQTRAKIRYALKKHDAAVQDLNMVRKLSPQNPIYYSDDETVFKDKRF